MTGLGLEDRVIDVETMWVDVAVEAATGGAATRAVG